MLQAVLLASSIAAWFLLDLGRHLSLAHLKASQAGLQALYASHPAAVLAAYALLYTLIFALALPVGAAMNLVGGALFGFWIGVAVVSLAATAGATLTFLAVRHLLAGPLRQRWGTRLVEVDAGLQREGACYLFAIRLMQIFPPGLVSALFGLTKLRLWTFAWVSLLGMLAGIVVFVNAGTQLAQLSAGQAILSPGLALSLLALGLLPLFARRGLQALRARGGSLA